MLTSIFKFLTSRKFTTAATVTVCLTCGTLWLAGQGPLAPGESTMLAQLVGSVGGSSNGPPRGATAPPESQSTKTPKLSEAQRLARLQRTITSDRQQLEALECQGEDPDGEFRRAEEEFSRIDERVDALDMKLDELRRAGRRREADELADESEPLTYEWRAAKDRLDLAIQQHKTLREKATALRGKIERDTQALSELIGGKPEEPPPPAEQPAKVRGQLVPVRDPAPAASATSTSAGPGLQPPLGGPFPTTPAAAADEPGPSNAAIELARNEVAQRRTAAREAEHEAQSVSERFESLRKNIAVEERLLEIARTKADQAQAGRAALDKEMQKKLIEDPTALESVWKKITEAERRYDDALAEVHDVQSRLNDLRTELGGLQDEHIAALGRAKQMHDEAERAQWNLDLLQNPFTPRNIIQWFLDHGPKLLAILLATLLLSLVVKLSTRHIARIVARSGSRGTALDRENRALTLVSVFRNTASIALLIGGLLMALDEVGLPVGPLMGGAAVLGLAVAFGAQNLIRDYFSGFMVLLEDQYGINDVVKIGDVSGSVEKITLRMTVLRDLEGAMHFIPHGSITRVTNMTHGWSRAVLDVGVAYKEDADRVMKVLSAIASELRKDPRFGPMILDGPEMLGLDELGDSAVVIKFFVKTQPLQRWPVRRELLRRIKQTFDELGIEIPFPQRTIHHRYDNGKPDEAHEHEPLDAPRDAR